MENQIQTVIFDLGGTLLEYAGPYLYWPELETPGLQAAYGHLEDKGVELPSFDVFRDSAFATLPDRWQKATEGERNLRLADFLAELLQANRVGGVPVQWIGEAAQQYQSTICSQATMIAGARETLSALKNQGYKIGLLSNTMFDGAIHVADLQRFDLDPYFDAMLFSADLNMWKPNAAPYLYLLDELQSAPQNTVFIGDSPGHDIVGGKAAGLHTIYFRSTDRFGEPDGVQPDATIYHLDELPDLLSGWVVGS